MTIDFNMCILFQNNDAYGFIDKEYIFHAVIPAIISRGFVSYGTMSLGYGDFDNLAISSSESFHYHVHSNPNMMPMFEI